jgi:CBS domain-containing protein
MSTVLPASLIVTHLYLGQTARRNPPHRGHDRTAVADNRLAATWLDGDLSAAARNTRSIHLRNPITLATPFGRGVRRLPVIDGHDLIGIVSQADVARNLPEDKIADLVEAISSAPFNS